MNTARPRPPRIYFFPIRGLRTESRSQCRWRAGLRRHRPGRKLIIQSKLTNLEQRFGVTATEINPAYTSQTCSVCGYVDRRNRASQSRFKCLWCGQTKHADFNAASNLEERRARLIGSVFQSKAAVLADLVRGFGERRMRAYGPRRTGSRGCPRRPAIDQSLLR
jgi:putative transposase